MTSTIRLATQAGKALRARGANWEVNNTQAWLSFRTVDGTSITISHRNNVS